MSNFVARLSERPEHTLRRALVVNAEFSALGGLLAAALGGPLSNLMDVNVWVVRAVGAALLVFACDVWFASRRPEHQLVPLARLISASDAVWVVGTAVVIAAGLVSGAGMVLLAFIGLVVADFAIVQLWSASKITAIAPIPQAA